MLVANVISITLQNTQNTESFKVCAVPLSPLSPLQRYLRVPEMKERMIWTLERMIWMKESRRKGSTSRGMIKQFPWIFLSFEDAAADEDEFTMMWGKLGLQPNKGQVNLVKENWQKIKGRIKVIWQELRLVIIDTFRNHARWSVARKSIRSSRNWRSLETCPRSWSSGWSCCNSLP